MPENYFGEEVATRYDSDEALMFEPAVLGPTVNFLADLAGAGPALELGIGTGRIALPLSERGIRVHGIDLSSAMVAQLRAKAGADSIGVTLGDFATTKVPGTFTLAYLVFNTICNLTTQDEQVECFRNVASHLEPGGCFVIEVGVPSLQRLQPGETFVTSEVSPRHLCVDEYDIAAQGLISRCRSAPLRSMLTSSLCLGRRRALDSTRHCGGWSFRFWSAGRSSRRGFNSSSP